MGESAVTDVIIEDGKAFGPEGQVIVGDCCYFDAIIDWEPLGTHGSVGGDILIMFDPIMIHGFPTYLCMIMLDPDK